MLPTDLSSNNIKSTNTKTTDEEVGMRSYVKADMPHPVGILVDLICWCGKEHEVHPCGDVC